MDSGDAKRLKQLEDEDWKLKHVMADLTLDKHCEGDSCSRAPVLQEGNASLALANPVGVASRLRLCRKRRDENPPIPLTVPY